MKHLYLVAALLYPAYAYAQSVTGQISGTVMDAAGAPIAGASAQLTNDLTRQVRTFTTGSSGSFIFADLVPGNYTLRVGHPGFKTYVQDGISVSSDEKVLAQEQFTEKIDFIPAESYRRMPAAKITIHMPLLRKAEADSYTIIVGFQLTSDQIAFNRSLRPQ